MQMTCEGCVKIVDLIGQQRPTRWPTCVVDEDVHGPECLNGRGKGRRNSVNVFQIQHQRLVTAAAQLVQFITKRGKCAAISGTNGDVGARFRQHFRRRFADAFAGAADQRVFAGQSRGGVREVVSEEVHEQARVP